jgi:putative ABC transport system permease protein
MLERELRPALERALPGIGFTFTRQHAEPAHRLIYEDAEGDQQMLSIFAFLILGGAAFAAFNMVSRTVEAQRREIGVGMALGVRPLLLGVRPVLLGLEIAALGVALGIPIGLWANSWLASILREWFPLPVLETPFEPDLYARGAALGLALPLAATLVPVWRAVRVHPIEAIRIGARAGKTGGLAWLVKGVHVPGGSLGNMPLRNVLRTPRRTALTALGVGAIVAIVVSMGGLMDSFDTTLNAARDEALGGSPARMTVDLATPQRLDSPVVTAVSNSPAVAGATPSLRLPVRLAGARSSRIDVFLETRAGGGLVIARSAAKALHARVGDEVAVRHPVPRADGSFGLATTRLRLTGINDSPFRFIAYISPARAAAIGLGGLANRVSVVPARGHDPLDVKRALLPLAGVGAVQGASAITDAVDDRMSQFDDILGVILTIAFVMALLMAYNTSAINADERARESATMFAFGVPVRRVLRIGVAEALMIGLLATAVGGVSGWLLLRWIAYSSMTETMPDVGMLLHIAPGTIVAAVIAGTVTVALAPLLTRRRLARTDIPSTLRVVE